MPETWEAHMTRPFFQPKSSPISRPMKPRRSQSHIPNCASCCSKSSAADTQWKILDMCVRGCSTGQAPQAGPKTIATFNSQIWSLTINLFFSPSMHANSIQPGPRHGQLLLPLEQLSLALLEPSTTTGYGLARHC